jgi:hypothetical protein
MGCSASRLQKHVLCGAIVATAALKAGPAWAAYTPNPVDFATSVVSYNLNNETLANYSDPTALLGAPTVTFNDPYGNTSGDAKKYDNAKIIEPPYYTDHVTGGPDLTEIPESTATATYSVTVQMGRPITNDPSNPYGIDLIVYGNSFFVGKSTANDSTNLHADTITGVFGHPLVVSVSPDDVNWYTFPTTADLLPYQAYQWDDTNQVSTSNLLNFNQPVDPAVAALALNKGYSTAAAVLDAYGTASGGTGYDIAASGFSSIDYVRVASSTTDYAVVDAIAAVGATPVPEPTTAGLICLGGLMLTRRRR